MRIFKRKKNPAPALKSRRSNAPAPHAVTNRERFPKALKILSFAPRPAPRFFRNFEKQYVTVSASPWAGKENMRQLRTAPLGGIVFLAQDKQNTIKRLSPKEAGVRLFLQFIIPCDNAEQVRFAAQYTERILERTPVWLLRNRGDGASAELCRRTLESELCCADN